MSQTSTLTSNPTPQLPSKHILHEAAKLALLEDKPILLDYWVSSFHTSLIGIWPPPDPNKASDPTTKIRILIKDAKDKDEYTSPIKKIVRPIKEDGTKDEYLIVTENSIYIVSTTIKSYYITNIDEFE